MQQIPLQVHPKVLENTTTDKLHALTFPDLNGCWLQFAENTEIFTAEEIGKKRCKWQSAWSDQKSSSGDNSFWVYLSILGNKGEQITSCDRCKAWRERTNKSILVVTPDGKNGAQFTHQPSIKLIFRCTPKGHESKHLLHLQINLVNFTQTKFYATTMVVEFRKNIKQTTKAGTAPLQLSLQLNGNKRSRSPSLEFINQKESIFKLEDCIPPLPIHSSPETELLHSFSKNNSSSIVGLSETDDSLEGPSDFLQPEELEGFEKLDSPKDGDTVMATFDPPGNLADRENGVVYEPSRDLNNNHILLNVKDNHSDARRLAERFGAEETTKFLSEKEKIIEEEREEMRIQLMKPRKSYTMHVTIKTNVKPHILIFYAFRGGYHDLGKELFYQFKVNWDIDTKNSTGHTLLHAVVSHGDYQGTEWCLNQGAKITATNNNGYTPLHLAYMRNDRKIIQLLESRGAPTVQHAVDNFGLIPQDYENTYYRTQPRRAVPPVAFAVHLQLKFYKEPFAFDIWYSCRIGFLEAVKLYIEKVGCPTEVKNSLGQTPLMAACEHQRVDVVEYLISKGASINVADVWLATPLHYAHMSGCNPLIAMLQERGADSTRRDYWGRTPRQYYPKSSSNSQYLPQLFQDQLTLGEIRQATWSQVEVPSVCI